MIRFAAFLTMFFLKSIAICCFIGFSSLTLGAQTSDAAKPEKLKTWSEGYLDIHFINTGRGDLSFLILPDGTTALIDAGNLQKEEFEAKYAPLKATSPVPNDALSAANYAARYIRNVLPPQAPLAIDYAIVTHFHDDHYGSLVALSKLVPVKNLIDRNYPSYTYPLDLKQFLSKNSIFQSYLSFANSDTVHTEAAKVGSTTQIKLLHAPQRYPQFQIRNVKANADIWTGSGEQVLTYFKADDMVQYYEGKYNENPLSLAFKISYGDFDYFTGGDNTGLQGFGLPAWFDVETPMAKAVGRVEVTTLNHHGNRDATNDFFVKTLDPKVVVQQLWCSDHPGQEVYQRLIYKEKNAEGRVILSTNMHPETLVTYGPWFKDNYQSTQGHIVVRVSPGGKEYIVYVLDDRNQDGVVKGVFGPFVSK